MILINLLNFLDNIIWSLLKITLISCNKFNFNFKCVYINEIGLKNCNRNATRCDILIQSKILQGGTSLAKSKGAKMGKRSLPYHVGRG